ncbi:hypothetical protein DFH08DRAFT_1001106, partial [Mycena albidolilacea]
YTKSCTQARRRQNGPDKGHAGTQCGVGSGQSALGRRNSGRRRADAHCMRVRHAGAGQHAPGRRNNCGSERMCGSAVGAGRRVLGRHTTATGGVRVRGAWGASRRNDSGSGVGAAWRVLVRNACRGRGSAHWAGATGRAARTCAAHGGHTEEGVGALGYTWCRVRPSRIGGASPGSEQRGGTANRCTAVLGAGSTCIPHGVGRCLGTQAAR